MVFKRNYKNNAFKEKQITVKRLGWKRIAKNTERFGWLLGNATKHTEITETTTWEGEVRDDTIYINPKTHRRSKVNVWLTFYRSREVGAGVGFLEFLYNIFYYLRKISLFCMPLLFAATVGLMILPNLTDYALQVVPWAIGSIFIWVGCIILETVFARIAGAILKKRKTPVNEGLRLTVADRSSNSNMMLLKDKNGNLAGYEVRKTLNLNGYNYTSLFGLSGVNKGREVVAKITHEGGEEFFDIEKDYATLLAFFSR